MKNTLRFKHIDYYNLVLESVFILSIAFWLRYQYFDFLYQAQELSLFLNSFDFFKSFIDQPGGLLLYAGTFLTQFFYNPSWGIAILICMLLIIQWLTVSTFRLNGRFFAFSFIPVAFIVVTITQIGYMMYVIKLPDMLYTQIMGVIFMLGISKGSTMIKKYEFRPLWITVAAVLTYPLAGVYSLAGGLISICIFAADKEDNYGLFNDIAKTIAIYIAVVLGYYHYGYNISMTRAWMYPLPDFRFNSAELILWSPYILLLLTFMIYGFFIQSKENNEKVTITGVWMNRLKPAILICSLSYIYVFSHKDDAFVTEIKVERAMDNQDWKGALSEIRNLKSEHTRKLVLLRNICLYHTSDMGNRMYSYPEGQRLPNAPRDISLVTLSSRPVYYNWGKFCFCYRWCMEDAVENGFRVEYLKYMTKCAIMSGELRVANKYIATLKKTRFHKEWAENYEQFIKEPELIAKDESFKPLLHLNMFDDSLDGDGAKIEVYLLDHFSKLTKGSVELSEVSLVSSMILKDIDKFWPRCFYYYQNKKELPKHYQEAAVLYEYLEKKVDTAPLNISPAIKTRFDSFMKLTEQFKTDDIEVMRPYFEKRFSDTFWFYYFFENNIKTY